MIRRAASVLLLLGLSSGPAAATGTISCSAPQGEASAELVVGSLPVLFVQNATVEAGGAAWSTNGEDVRRIVVGQRFADEETLRVDFTDDNVERVLVELRLFKASEGSAYATAGTLRVAGVGAWAVSCVGP